MSETVETPAPPDEQYDALQEQQDYFGFGGEDRFIFPDGVSFVSFRVMNEGQRKKFETLTQRDMVLERKSGDARVGMNPAEQRHALLRTAITGWNLKRGNRPVPFTERNLLDFLELSDPKLIDEIERAIRQKNPWLLGEMTVEDVDREIANLQEVREELLRKERGEGSSASR